jgi:hypothetical protein
MVNNVGLGGALPEITTETSDTPKQLYRNTDNKVFYPDLIVLTNQDSSTTQIVKLVDADLSDDGENDYKAETYPIYTVAVGPSDSVVLNRDDLHGLCFQYGVCGYNSVSKAIGSGVLVYINGDEL